ADSLLDGGRGGDGRRGARHPGDVQLLAGERRKYEARRSDFGAIDHRIRRSTPQSPAPSRVGHTMSTSSTDVLLVEDDARLAELTSRYLRQNGLTVEVESNGAAAVARFREVRPRLVLLDLMLPGKDGLTICRELRQTFAGPILMLTAKDADIDQVIGLEAGADDYVAKPAEPMVLLARIRALLRRAEGAQAASEPAASGEIVLGGLRVNEASHRVWLDGEEISLTTQEFELLLVLVRSAGKILSREELFR